MQLVSMLSQFAANSYTYLCARAIDHAYVTIPKLTIILLVEVEVTIPTTFSASFRQWVFLPDVSSREHLALPLALQVDYRAACFCHQRLVEMGFVCSVCLSSELVCGPPSPFVVTRTSALLLNLL